MSSDIDPKFPKPTKKDMARLKRELVYYGKVSKETPNDKLAMVAFGISAGIKRALSENEIAALCGGAKAKRRLAR